MNTTPSVSTLLKTSDFVVSIFKVASDHAPLVLGLFFTFVSISLTSKTFFPIYFYDFHWAFPFLSIFLGIYILAFSYYSQRRFIEGRRRLNKLGEDEKALLRCYLEEDVSCKMLSPIFNGRAATLIGKGILVISTSTFDALNAPVAIDPRYQDYIRERPETIGLSKADIGKKSESSEPNFEQ